jgi:hypothetical protein
MSPNYRFVALARSDGELVSRCTQWEAHNRYVLVGLIMVDHFDVSPEGTSNQMLFLLVKC